MSSISMIYDLLVKQYKEMNFNNDNGFDFQKEIQQIYHYVV